MFLFSPKTLQNLNKKLSASVNKVTVPIDEKVYKLRVGVGIALLFTI